ncbi:MAG: hypothetical protein WD801_03625 [Gemmatimonadaceae bacterium]
MKTYIIGYDLNRPGQQYTELIKAIEAYGTYWHHLDSTWIIKTDDSAAGIRDNLRQFIDSTDELLVIRHQGDAAWSGINDRGSQWLMDHL